MTGSYQQKISRAVICAALLSWLATGGAGPVRASQLPASTGADSPLEKGDSLRQVYRNGLQALSDKDYSTALTLFRACLRRAPGFAPAMLGLAQTYARLDEASRAVSWIRKAVQVAPDDPHVQNSLGRLQLRQGNLTAARKSFRKALALNPDLAGAWASLGDLDARTAGALDKAVDDYRRALKIDPLNAKFLYRLGTLYARQNKGVEAATALRKASRFEPDNPDPKLALAELAKRNGRFRDAMGWVEQVLARQPHLIGALWLKADIANHAGRHRVAVEALEDITGQQPQSASAWLLLGSNREGLGDPKGARKAYLQALKLRPDLVPALNNFAWIAANQGRDLDRALKMARRAVELRPKVPAFRDTLAWVYFARGDTARAEQVLARLLKVTSPGKPVGALVRLHFGLVQGRLGERKEGAHWLRQALIGGLSPANAKRARATLASLSGSPG